MVASLRLLRSRRLAVTGLACVLLAVAAHGVHEASQHGDHVMGALVACTSVLAMVGALVLVRRPPRARLVFSPVWAFPAEVPAARAFSIEARRSPAWLQRFLH